MTRSVVRCTALAIVVMLGWPGSAPAQQPPPPATRRFEAGPVSVQPRLEIYDVGIDDNIFNDSENPKSDFTATIAPRIDATLRMGVSRLNVGAFTHFVYFRDFEEERSLDRGAEARFEIGEGLLRPHLIASIVDTRERLNPEIDARARHRRSLYGGGVNLALTSRSSFVFAARRATLDFDEGEQFRGVALAQNLDEHVDTFDLGMRIALTPLTAWDNTIILQRDRFEAGSLRDSDSTRFTTALEFSPSAVISGRAAVGYLAFNPVDPSLPEYGGIVALVSTAYAVEGTKVEVAFEHDVRYSFEDRLPYYIASNGRLTLTQRIAGPVDVQGTVGWYLMSYRGFEEGPEEARRDEFALYGGGIGYRLGDAARLGLNAEWSQRRSDALIDREYDRQRIFVSLTYGF